jgi:peptidyl-dipeptidase Dcp
MTNSRLLPAIPASTLLALLALLAGGALVPVLAADAADAPAASRPSFGPDNPLFRPSALPFHAPPFDKIKDADYQPAIEAGMAEELAEILAIADDPAPPTFANTLLAMENSGSLLARALAPFRAVTAANTNPVLQAADAALAPKLAAHADAIHLNKNLFARVAAVYRRRRRLKLDPESLRLVEVTYAQFVHAGANLADDAQAKLKLLNERESTLSNTFQTRLLAATKAGAYQTTAKEALRGLNEAGTAAAAETATERQVTGFVVPLQNTTQQPVLASLADRDVRERIFQNSWNRAERGDENDTRDTIAALAQVRAQQAALLGFPNHAAWKLSDQMAKTPAAALKFMAELVPLATAKALREAGDIQAAIDGLEGGFQLAAWDWEFYAQQVRKQKYDLNEDEVKPYFEIDHVLQNGVFYAAHELYGITFQERKDIPVYQPDVRVFEVFDADGKPLALFYCDYFKRDNKSGGAWMSNLVDQSSVLGDLPVVYNVANFQKPAAGEPALISFEDVTTMFHEFGHALHGMFADTKYRSLSGTSTPRDFVEFPSQFNEHWAIYPGVFAHYARHYQTGAAMPPELAAKLLRARNFGEGYSLTETLAAAELDMHWHVLPASAPLQDPDAFERLALRAAHIDLAQVPPRYRSSYFMHIWANGYSAGYYAYLWTQMLDDDAYLWFDEHGGLTRANGERFRRMVLSRGNTSDLERLYIAWRGRAPTVAAMMKYRELKPDTGATH